MSLSRRRFLPVLLLAALLSIPGSVRAADSDTASQPHRWDAEIAGDPPPPKKGHKHPVIRMVKGVGSELKYDAQDTVKDMCFVFSAQDIDPYDTPPPDNKPYTLASFNLVDGTSGHLVKYPDGSGRIFGTYADGTVLIPTGTREWAVKYPNGVQGKLKQINKQLMQITRPDGTVTTCQRQASGGYRISNDKIGYMGDVQPDGNDFSFNMR